MTAATYSTSSRAANHGQGVCVLTECALCTPYDTFKISCATPYARLQGCLTFLRMFCIVMFGPGLQFLESDLGEPKGLRSSGFWNCPPATQPSVPQGLTFHSGAIKNTHHQSNIRRVSLDLIYSISFSQGSWKLMIAGAMNNSTCLTPGSASSTRCYLILASYS